MNRYILLFLISLIATSSAFSQTPKTAEDFNNRGVSRRSQGDVEGAIEDFTKAISLKGLPIIIAAAYNNRANALLSKNDVEGALADYTKAIELAPTDHENYYNRGVVLLNKNSLDLAIADFTKVIELQPQFHSPITIEVMPTARKATTTPQSQITRMRLSLTPNRLMLFTIAASPCRPRRTWTMRSPTILKQSY